jgi:hypothetical protein
MSYGQDRAFSDRFIPAIKRIVGPRLLEVSGLKVDCEQAADLIVMRNQSITIACRVRKYGYADRYPDQFTIRSKRDNGARTEYEKIYFDGWGDWMFYGHQAAPESCDLNPWWIINLRSFRTALKHESCASRNGRQPAITVHSKSNGDGTHFYAFSIPDFPATPPLLIAQFGGGVDAD